MVINFLKNTINFLALFLFVLTLFSPGVVFGIDNKQREVYDLGAEYYDIDSDSETTCSPGGNIGEVSNNIPEPHLSVLISAGTKFSVSPNLIAALFLSEQGNVWKPFEGPYASSNAGASGPFQFMPGTWRGYGVDGNDDGVVDIQNFEDAAHAAANMASANGVTTDTPLGDINKPFRPGTIIYFAMSYNWGPGNVGRQDPESLLSVAPLETERYANNIYTLFTSDFTKSGTKNYGDPRMPDGSPVSSNASNLVNNCSSSGNIQNLAASNAQEARELILTSSNIVWGNYGPEVSQKLDVENCLTETTLISFATIASSSSVNIPINALARDHGGCNSSLPSHHNKGRAIDIGYHGSNSAGDPNHKPEGDTLYKLLYDNRELLQIDQLIWQYPPAGYDCINNGLTGACDSLYNQSTMNDHYHHIHVSFKQ